ncbi:hypothetical protein D9619_007754 [Psilocybe cf. subviscida]|uniref:Uncharacterized protein n=1 Tax=Psilocybe cf. subviscida TaxID=2480587 RepID=A0A8H5ESL6_9AGAR|nr:hypothetical protein D9619_007754 [Psilocybe cf. subviscida]
MEYQRLQYTLPLNGTTLIFFPPQANTIEEHEHDVSRAVQVRMKQAHQDTMREMLVFFDVQYDISKAVETIIFAHIIASLPSKVTVKGDGFVLTGKRKSSSLAKSLNLAWDGKKVFVCDYRWIFTFRLLSKMKRKSNAMRNDAAGVASSSR